MIRWSIRSGGSCAAPFRLRISASIIRSKSSRALLNPPCRRQRQVPEQLAAGQQEAVEHAHPGFEHIADLRRLRLDVGVEDRPADDVECEVGHRRVDVELHAVSPASRRALRGRHHLGAVGLDHGPAEHRLDHPPPAQVVGALAGEQPVTEQASRRPQRAALHKRRMLVDEDAADEVRIADEDGSCGSPETAPSRPGRLSWQHPPDTAAGRADRRRRFANRPPGRHERPETGIPQPRKHSTTGQNWHNGSLAGVVYLGRFTRE